MKPMLKAMTELKQFADTKRELEVRVFSFAYKKAYRTMYRATVADTFRLPRD